MFRHANSAGQAAMYFARYARNVTILTRSPLEKGMSHYLTQQISEMPNISVRIGTGVAEAHGEKNLTALTIADAVTGKREVVPASALFIFIGAQPHTDWLAGLVERDERGFVLTGPDLPRAENGRIPGWPLDREPLLLETSVPGILAAGDVRHASVKRVASGVGEGAIAVSFVHQYLSESKV